MGLNIDLTYLFGLPAETNCPNCKRKMPTHFEDYDIEGPGFNPRPGIVVLDSYCGSCETEIKETFKVELVKQQPEPDDQR